MDKKIAEVISIF